MLNALLIGSVLAVAGGTAAVFGGRRRFNRRVGGEVEALLADASEPSLSRIELDLLPPPVLRYLRYAGVLNRPLPRSVRLEHDGTLRTGPGQPWMPIVGVEYLSARPPALVWYATVHPVPFISLRARDRYLRERGHMLVTAMGAVPIANARGPELDQGALLRFLAEAAWIPPALLPGPGLEWSAVDDETAVASLRDGETTVSATFHFAPDGRITRVEAQRYRSVKGGFELAPWWGTYQDYRETDGLRIPMEVEVSWRLPIGPFPYARFRLTHAVFAATSARSDAQVFPVGSSAV